MDFFSAIDRRQLLASGGAAAVLAGCGSEAQRGSGPLRVVVVGAGILGASIAYFLSRGGAKVTIIDKEGPASHASKGTFAWINASWAKQPRHYHSLNQLGVSGWGVLEEELGIPVRWSGSLEWFSAPERMDRLAAQIKEQQDWGEPAQILSTAEVAGREPGLAAPAAAAFSPKDGAVDPVLATTMMIKGAEKFDATLIAPATLEDVVMAGGRVKAALTSQGPIDADRVVLATGAAPDLPALIAKSPVPQRTTPGVIAITHPMRPVLRHILAAPGVHMHQQTDGRIVLGEQAGPPKDGNHQMFLAGRPRRYPSPDIAGEHASRLRAMAAAQVPALADAKMDETVIGWRPLPIDGHPVIGASPQRPDVYLAISHSGVTLAPAIGQLAAYEIIENRAISRLAPYRPGRDFETVVRY